MYAPHSRRSGEPGSSEDSSPFHRTLYRGRATAGSITDPRDDVVQPMDPLGAAA
jgi:hypothetical protein